MEKKQLSLIYFIILLLLASFIMIIFASSYIHALIFAFIIGGILFPVNEMVHKKIKLPRMLSAIIICLLLFSLILIPFVFVIYQASLQSIDFYQKLLVSFNSNNGYDLPQTSQRISESLLSIGINVDAIMIEDYLARFLIDLSEWLVSKLESITKNLFNFITQFALMLLILIGVLSYGYKLKRYVLTFISPEKQPDVQLLIEKFNRVNLFTIVVNSLVAVFQGASLGIVMLILDFNSALLFSVLISISAMIPIVAGLLVSVPLSIYYYLSGYVVESIIFLSVAIVLDIAAENFIKPKLLSIGVKINPLLLLLSVIGGISTFGVLGLFYGPLVLGIFLTLVEIYKTNVK